MEDKEKIEELLHYFRMEQKDFAEKCGFRPQVISDIKFGKCGISGKVANKIINKFPEINIRWLIGSDKEMFVNQSIIGSKNVQAGNIIVGSNVDGNGNTVQHTIPSEDNMSYLKQIIKEKDELIKEKDERIREKDERIREKNERISELMEEKTELKRVINELKGK